MANKRLMPLEDKNDLCVEAPKLAAGGIGAIVSTMKHAVDKMGVGRGARALLKVNQQGGFDCPGCAWPDPKHRSMAEFCENGAKAVADEATKGTVGPAFFARHHVDELLEKTDHWLNKQGRLTHPMVRRPNQEHYQEIGWDEAFELIATSLNALDSPDQAVFYTSGRTSNEAAFLYQLFVRAFGTNNMPDCSNMCHESSGVGLGETIGIGKGTVLLEDFDKADTIFVIGQNPGTNHPRMLSALQSAKRNGAKVVSINPLRETGLVAFVHPQEIVNTALGHATPIADEFLQVRIGADLALLQAIMKIMLEDDSFLDTTFIAEQTEGFEAFRAALDAQSLPDLIASTGVSEVSIRRAAKIARDSKAMIVCWAMGITQHKNGVANVQACVNMLLMGGHIGRPGAGACPVRGHSNVQGDRTMGIVERPAEAFLAKLDHYFGIQTPRGHGLDTVHAIKAMHSGEAKVFFGMGGNFLSATPDTAFTAKALQACELTVQVSTKLNRGHLIHGKTALILPCLVRSEIDVQNEGPQFVTVENSMGIVHASHGHNKPIAPSLLSESDIVGRLALAALPDCVVDWEGLVSNYDNIRDAIEACIPGFECYNERVRTPNGFELPNGPRHREFSTDTGKAKFMVHKPPTFKLADDELLMMTMRSHDQYNTTIYGLDDRYRGVYGGRRVILMHVDDIAAQGLQPAQSVDIVSTYDGVERLADGFVVVAYDIPRGCVGTYFPEANVLIPVDSFADRSHTPTSKSIVVRLRA